MEELPNCIQQDVFQYSNGLIYKFCSGWEVATRQDLNHDESRPSSSKSMRTISSQSSYLKFPGTTLFGYGDDPILDPYDHNPCDWVHLDYDDTDPGEPHFFESGWCLNTPTTAPSASTGSPLFTKPSGGFVMPLLSSYCVLSIEDAIPVAANGNHPLVTKGDIQDMSHQQSGVNLEPVSPCGFGLWVKQLISRNYKKTSVNSEDSDDWTFVFEDS